MAAPGSPATGVMREVPGDGRPVGGRFGITGTGEPMGAGALVVAGSGLCETADGAD